MNSNLNSSILYSWILNQSILSNKSHIYYAILHSEFLYDAELVGFEILADDSGFIDLTVKLNQ